MEKKISSSKLISLIFSVSVLCFAVVSLSYAAWTAPTGIPPDGNVSAPLNISGAAQAKVGGLIINCGSGENCISNSNDVGIIGLSVPNGNVGIGTMAPVIKLAIGDTDTGLNWISDGNLAVYTNNMERMRIDSSGNVGIGTMAPGAKLEVNGGLKLNTTATKPLCDATNSGTLWYKHGAVGVKDTLEICTKNDNNLSTYGWRIITQ